MDRRTLLAIALSFLVITVWMQLFGPKPPERPESGSAAGDAHETRPEPGALGEAPPDTRAPRRESALTSPTEPGRGTAAIDPSSFGSGEGHVTEIEVVTPLYVATFSSRGGGMTSLVPLDYEREDGGVLDLVPGDRAQPVLTIDRDGPRGYAPLDMSEVNFDVRREAGGALAIQTLTFTALSDDGVRVERRYVFRTEGFTVGVLTRVTGLPEALEGAFSLEWTSGLPVTEKQSDLDLTEFGSLIKVGENLEKEKLNHFGPDRVQAERYEGEVLWAASKSKYFISALVLDEGEVERARAFGDFSTSTVAYALESPIAGGSAQARHALYVGPIKQRYMAELHHEFAHADLERHVGISTMPLGSVFGWFARLVYSAMTAIHSVIPNYGVVILILALVTKIIFFPLTRKSSQSMRAMSDLRPELEGLREKFKNDPQKMNQETFALYKKHGVNPVAGCLPLLIQMPVFMALYGVLRSAIELRQAPFVAWVSDLSAPDTLISFGTVPLIPDSLHVLPLLMAGSTFLMQRKTITDPRQQMLMYLMPVMMLFFFYNLPSGLNLYWTSQNLLAWAEQTITKGKVTPVTAKAA